jgi:hypothetical protein
MELASILAAHWQIFAAQQRHILTAAHYRAARAVMRCRTAELGGEMHQCAHCTDQFYHAYHSCNHRACTKCGGREQKEWTAAQEAKLIPRVPYFMLTLTLPSEMRAFAYKHQAWFYDAMFKAMQSVLMDFAQDKRHLGGTPGFSAVLHTWTREMVFHPHLHVIMPGIALSADGLRVFRAKDKQYLFPVDALKAAWRNRLDRLILQHDKEQGTRHYSQIDPQVWKKDWVIDIQAVGNGKHALRYLARYVHKTAVSQQRLLGYDEQGRVRLNCQDSDTGKWYVILLTPTEFIRRWCLHILPKGFTRVRHYGLHSAPAKAKYDRVHHILGSTPAPKPAPLPTTKPKCPCCGKDMVHVSKLPTLMDFIRAQLRDQQARPPPLTITRGQRVSA